MAGWLAVYCTRAGVRTSAISIARPSGQMLVDYSFVVIVRFYYSPAMAWVQAAKRSRR